MPICHVVRWCQCLKRCGDKMDMIILCPDGPSACSKFHLLKVFSLQVILPPVAGGLPLARESWLDAAGTIPGKRQKSKSGKTR